MKNKENNTTWFVPVPYSYVGFVSGERWWNYLNVEIPKEKIWDFIESWNKNPIDSLMMDYIVSIHPYGENCPLDSNILKNPKFVNKPENLIHFFKNNETNK